MHTQFLSRNLVNDIDIPIHWSDFWMLLVMGFVCLFISAYFAKVRIGSLPANPIYWHYWIVANATAEPTINDDTPRIYRPYMFFWAASICLFACAPLVLIAMFIVG